MPEITFDPNDTIQINQILDAFGQKAKTNKREIFDDLLMPSNIERYMKTERGVKGIFEMQRTEMSEVTQPFQTAFTPKGELVFEPSEIVMRRAKIDNKFEIDKFYHSYMSWLVEEGKDRKDQTITAYFISETLRKAKEDRGRIAVKGKYVAPQEGVASPSLDTADGTLYNLKKIQDNPEHGLNAIEAGDFEAAPFDYALNLFRAFGDNLHLLAEANNTWFTSKTNVHKVADAYQADNSYKNVQWLNASDPVNGEYGIIVPNTGNGRLIGIDHMDGDRFFAVPRWNFLRCVDQIDELGRLELQKFERILKLLADYSLAYGFGFNKWVFSNVATSGTFYDGSGEGEGEGE